MVTSQTIDKILFMILHLLDIQHFSRLTHPRRPEAAGIAEWRLTLP